MLIKDHSFTNYIIMAFFVISKSHTINASNAPTQISLCCPPDKWYTVNEEETMYICANIMTNDQLLSTINVLDPENTQTKEENIFDMDHTVTARFSGTEISSSEYNQITFFKVRNCYLFVLAVIVLPLEWINENCNNSKVIWKERILCFAI